MYLFWMISWDFTMFRRKFTSQFIDSTISIIRGNNHQLSWMHLRNYDHVLLLSEQPKLNRLVDQYIWLQENFVNSCLPRLCVAIFLNNQVWSVNIMFRRKKLAYLHNLWYVYHISCSSSSRNSIFKLTIKNWQNQQTCHFNN